MRRIPAPALLMLVLLAGAAPSAFPAGAAADTLPPELDYNILHDGSVIGHERMTFHRDGEQLLVHSEVAMKVELLFITAFRFEQTRDEVWRNDRLVTYTAVTNDNGTHYNVKAEAAPDGIKVASGADRWVLPPDGVPLSFWHISSVTAQGPLFDVETGKLIGATPVKLGEEQLTAAGKPVATTHYRIKSDRTDDLWYDGNGRLVKAVVVDKNGEAEWMSK